jgi:hypothetical protein
MPVGIAFYNRDDQAVLDSAFNEAQIPFQGASADLDH